MRPAALRTGKSPPDPLCPLRKDAMDRSQKFHLQQHAHGTILPVRAQPKARRREVRLLDDGTLKLCVPEPPEKGKANKAIRALLIELLGKRGGQLELIAGKTSQHKRFLVRGMAPEEVAERLDRALRQAGK